MKKTVFLVLSLSKVGLGIFSPKFLTVIFSPSRVTLDPSLGKSSKFDKTPVILNSTLFVKSPSSYPNINSSLLKSSVDLIELPIPVQSKNWLIDLSPYVIVLTPVIPFVTTVPEYQTQQLNPLLKQSILQVRLLLLLFYREL